jgi:tetratricopeptide (TPR) repeat protein
MLYLRSLAPIVLALTVIPLQAQLRAGATGIGGSGNVHIHIVFDNDRAAGSYLVVRLMEGGSNTVLGTTYTDDRGEAQFLGVPIGDYHVEVSGDGIQSTASDTFEVDQRRISQAEYVVVHRVEDSGPRPLSAKSPMISAADLNVPGKARKEVDKANEAMALHDWKKALEHLNKAITLAPQYATAYNNMGVLYAKTNDIPHEEEALKKAVAIDEHFAPALVNYGKLCLSQKNPAQAEVFLQKAATAEPDNSETLMLLAYSQYLNRHFDAAITNSLQAHSTNHDHPSFVHYIAARSYQQENQQAQALGQFQAFLQEEPKGPRADHVRADIAKIQNASQQAQAR